MKSKRRSPRASSRICRCIVPPRASGTASRGRSRCAAGGQDCSPGTPASERAGAGLPRGARMAVLRCWPWRQRSPSRAGMQTGRSRSAGARKILPHRAAARNRCPVVRVQPRRPQHHRLRDRRRLTGDATWHGTGEAGLRALEGGAVDLPIRAPMRASRQVVHARGDAAVG